jgi:hypothetical protein
MAAAVTSPGGQVGGVIFHTDKGWRHADRSVLR